MSAVGRFLSTLLLGLVAGIPYMLGIAVESAVIAWVIDGLRWFGDPGFATVFWWTFGVQAGIVCLFAVPGVVVTSIDAARHGWDAARSDRRGRQRGSHYSATDLAGRRLGTREDIEAEVSRGLAAKQSRLDRIEAVLAKPGLPPTDQRVHKLQEERRHLLTFFWLARGGDRRDEPFPYPIPDMSAEEIDLLAKLRALDDMT